MTLQPATGRQEAAHPSAATPLCTKLQVNRSSQRYLCCGRWSVCNIRPASVPGFDLDLDSLRSLISVLSLPFSSHVLQLLLQHTCTSYSKNKCMKKKKKKAAGSEIQQKRFWFGATVGLATAGLVLIAFLFFLVKFQFRKHVANVREKT